MLINLAFLSNIIQKTIKLTILLLFVPCFFWGQQQLTGLWTGSLSNDSTTTRKEQSLEIALTEYRGKVYGYSRSEFIMNDTLFYILKRVKGTIDGDSCEVKDDEILSYNFRGRLDKGVRMIYTFRMNDRDSTWHLDGHWKTTKTKRFYSISGDVTLKEEKDLTQSKIFPHLEELKLADKIAFYKEEKNQKETVTITKQENTKAENIAKALIKKPTTIISRKTDVAINNVDMGKKIHPQATEERVTDTTQLISEKNEKSTALNNAENNRIQGEENGKSIIPNNQAIINNKPASLVLERKFEFTAPVIIKSDSLQLSLYDNGEIDGDTVSVLLNGNIIISKEGLKVTAIKRTIHITPEMGDSLILVLYAENLGKYPPNTGLLVIHDGEDSYPVRFSADLQTNAAIILKRKK